MLGQLDKLPNLSRVDGGVELAARLGYTAKGVVYGTIGVLAVMAASGMVRGQVTGTRGVLEAFNAQPWGPFVLAFLAVGLSGLTVWRAVQCLSDPEHLGEDTAGMLQRAGLMASGLIYGYLAYYAARLFLHSTEDHSTPQQRAAEVMTHDGGALLIGGLGLILAGTGVYQLYLALSRRFKRQWATRRLTPAEERFITFISQLGIGSRAAALLLIGAYLCWAALTGEPGRVQGLEGTLIELGNLGSGPWLLGFAGLGLLCYGLYCFVEASFHAIDLDDR